MVTSNVPGTVPEEKPNSTVRLDAAVFGASVQLPVFDKMEPESWFCVADANFALRKVSDSVTKYYYVLSKLDSTSLKKLSAFLKRPRGPDPYQEIRAKLYRTFEPPKEQKLDTLLATNDMGDERPMEFGMELQRLAGEATAKDFIKRIFLRSLPPANVTAITSSLSAKLETVMEAADEVWAAAAAATPATATVSAVSNNQPGRTGNPRRGGRGGRQRGSGASGQASMTTFTLCNFHKKFGDAARKCAPTCSR